MQRTGTILAAGVGVVFVGVLGWYVLHAGKAAGPAPAAPRGPTRRPDSLIGQGDPGELQIVEGEGVQIDLMDKKDLRRQTGLLKFDTLEPLEAHHYEAGKPEAWLYMNDGRTLHIRAATGKLYMPDRDKEPESGTLSGGVTADLFDAREDGARVQVGTDQPFLTFKTQTLSFDSTLGKLSTQDKVTVVSRVADFSGNGMEVLFNQVKQRLELCKIGPGENSAVFHTGAKPQKKAKRVAMGGTPTQGSGTPASATPATAAAPPQAKTPVETLYRMDFDQAVGLVQGTRNLAADKLQVWARLIDGDLPDGAIAQVRGQAEGGSPAGAAPVAPSGPAAASTSAVAQAPGQGAAPVMKTGPGGEITLRWSGPCVIAPLAETPPELKTEQLAARFTATEAVKLGDSERGLTGKAGSVEYGATSGKLLLVGKDGGRPKLDWPNAGTIETDRIEGDLSHGLIHIPAAGSLRQAKRDGEVRWGEQADFSLVVRDGAVVGELKQATFGGGFTISDKNATISGGFARADFVSTAAQPNILSRLIVNDKASAVSDKSGRIDAGTLDVAFVVPAPGRAAGDPEPKVVTATDHVVVAQKDSKLTADWLEAHMGRTPAGAIDVTSANAKGSVVMTREKDQLVARADEMHADLGWTGKIGDAAQSLRREIVDLLGPDVTIKRGEKSTLAATQVRLNGIEHSVEVFGKGTFDHNEPQKKAVISARWETGMTFNDEAGTMECSGRAHALSLPDALTSDEIDAERLELGLTPGTGGDEGSGKTRELLWAKAIGSVLEREGGVNASITSERFVPDSSAPEGRRREQLQYLEGPRIDANNTAGTLDVPGAGRLVIVDHKSSERPSPTDSGSLSIGGSQGDSLFTWANSLHMERASGRADIDGTVRLTHRSLKDRQVTNLDCAHLTAVARTKGGPNLTEGASLVSATARGAVYATVGPEAAPNKPRPPRKELIADEVEYDAIKGTLDAAASAGGMVTIFDPGRGSPVSAGRLFWDLSNDRIEVKNLEPIVGPK